MRCNRCGATVIYRDNWPACHCDAIPGLMLTVREAAHFMSMSRGGIYHWVEEGLITANRSQRPIRIAMTSLKAFLAAEHVAWTNRHVTGRDDGL
jgi:excisionase family DNA binding protein